MAAFSTYLADELLDEILSNSAYSQPATVYLALFTSGTNLDANNQTNEVSGGSYARQSCAFDVAAARATANTADVTFGPATAGWGTVTHAAICDALTTGQILLFGQLVASKTVNNGDTFKFLAGDFNVTFT